tara:strand:+ start:3177 stop:3758 length:582 start_codon:yes stop_codon:yes gene_type:complete
MSLTKSQLSRIIKEEISAVLNESFPLSVISGRHMAAQAKKGFEGAKDWAIKKLGSNPYRDTGYRGANNKTCRVNGCGGSVRIPGSGKYRGCCDEHDKCYCRGGDATDRKKCDARLYACLKNRGAFSATAMAYYASVRKYGKGHFNRGAKKWEKIPVESPGVRTVKLKGFPPLSEKQLSRIIKEEIRRCLSKGI